MGIATAIGFLIFFALRVDGNDVTCKKVSACACKMTNGDGLIDLASLASKDQKEPAFKTSDGKYMFNPCLSFDGGNNCNVERKVAVCQEVLGGLSCGTQTNSTVKYDPGTGNVTFVYMGGDDDRESHIELVCSRSANQTTLQFINEEPGLHYNFHLIGPCCCPGVCKGSVRGHSISAGSVLVIIFFVVLVTYFVAGLLFKKFKSGASGKEIVPNHAFWFVLPGLIKDGILFAFTCGRKKPSNYAPLD